jgi:hypothetical protein
MQDYCSSVNTHSVLILKYYFSVRFLLDNWDENKEFWAGRNLNGFGMNCWMIWWSERDEVKKCFQSWIYKKKFKEGEFACLQWLVVIW